MAIEEGKESNAKSEAPQNEALIKLVAEMQKKLERLEQKPTQVAGLNGLSADQFAELISKVSNAVKTRPEAESLTMTKFVESRDIDPEDYDPKGVRFSAFGTGYVVVDDLRNGFPVQTPFKNMIVFTYTGSRRGNRNERGEVELATFSSFVSHSKLEQKWLREHRQFGVKFFESSAAALSVNAERSQMLSRFIDSLAAQDQNQVLSQCQQYGIAVSGDMRNMRIALAEKMVEKQFESQKKASEKMLTEAFEEEVFRSGTATTSEAKGRQV